MELYQLEEMAGSEKTGFCGLYGANSTGGRGWGAEESAVGKTMAALAQRQVNNRESQAG